MSQSARRAYSASRAPPCSVATRRPGAKRCTSARQFGTRLVGITTSAFLEAAIVDRPVFTILAPEFRDNQEGTFHFHHLLDVGEGFLNVSRSIEEHVTQLAGMLAGGPVRANRPFVEQFIRPRGVAVAATPVFADAVEALARETSPRRSRNSVGAEP